MTTLAQWIRIKLLAVDPALDYLGSLQRCDELLEAEAKRIVRENAK